MLKNAFKRGFCVAVDGSGPDAVQGLPAGDLGALAGGGRGDGLRDHQPGGRQERAQEEGQAEAKV